VTDDSIWYSGGNRRTAALDGCSATLIPVHSTTTRCRTSWRLATNLIECPKCSKAFDEMGGRKPLSTVDYGWFASADSAMADVAWSGDCGRFGAVDVDVADTGPFNPDNADAPVVPSNSRSTLPRTPASLRNNPHPCQTTHCTDVCNTAEGRDSASTV
jgi:hypothetical protein